MVDGIVETTAVNPKACRKILSNLKSCVHKNMALCIIGRHDFTWSTRDVSVRSVPWAETER